MQTKLIMTESAMISRLEPSIATDVKKLKKQKNEKSDDKKAMNLKTVSLRRDSSFGIKNSDNTFFIIYFKHQ